MEEQQRKGKTGLVYEGHHKNKKGFCPQGSALGWLKWPSNQPALTQKLYSTWSELKNQVFLHEI